MIATFFSLFVPLFILMNFLGTIPVFLALTREEAPAERLRIALFASSLAGIIVLLFAVTGREFMEFFGLSMEAVRVAGGLLLLAIAFKMTLTDQTINKQSGQSTRSIVVSPLAIPLLAGPGSMTFAAISYMDLLGAEKLLMLAAVLAAALLGALLFALSSTIDRLLGPDFTRGLEKVTGVIISFIALEMIMGGLRGYFLAA